MMDINKLLCQRIWRCASQCTTLARHFWKLYNIIWLYRWCKIQHIV